MNGMKKGKSSVSEAVMNEKHREQIGIGYHLNSVKNTTKSRPAFNAKIGT